MGLLTCNFPRLAIHITSPFWGWTKPLSITWGNHQTVSRVSVKPCWVGAAFCIWSYINNLLPDFRQRNHRQVVKTVEDIKENIWLRSAVLWKSKRYFQLVFSSSCLLTAAGFWQSGSSEGTRSDQRFRNRGQLANFLKTPSHAISSVNGHWFLNSQLKACCFPPKTEFKMWLKPQLCPSSHC